MVPFLAFAAGSAGFLERVPTLPATLAEAQSGFAGLQAKAEALRRDIEAAQSDLDETAETNAAVDEERAQQQASDLQAMTGMSAEEMDAADEDEVADKMLEGFGMSMADMEAVAEMDDEEAEAYFASKQANAKPSNTEGLRKLAGNVPSGADAEKLDRLIREFGDWSAQNTDRTVRAIEEYQALNGRWADDHARLNAKLDVDLAPRVRSVPVVDCGEAGEYADAVETHAIALERATAHAVLASGHLRQGLDYLAGRREAVKADAIFADSFAVDAQGVAMMNGQSYTARSQALLGIEGLLDETVEVTRNLLSWEGEKAGLESIRPKSSCG